MRYARPSGTRRLSFSSVESARFNSPHASFVSHARPPVTHADESDARHGAYDFYAEQLAAPDDLKHLTEENESMAFRRRGYEVSESGRRADLSELVHSST